MPRLFKQEDVPAMKSEDMVRDMLELPQVLRRLAEQELEWEPLARALLEIGSATATPTGKLLQQKLGLSASKYRRWLDALYDAYLNLLENDADAVLFEQVEHQLILTSRRASQAFSCRLPVTPRVGEQLQLHFLRAVTGESMFYVESIIHDFTDGRYAVLVYLKVRWSS
jgi:DNA-binding transcriptional ArsR family regulator